MTFLEKKRFAESLQYNQLSHLMGWQISGAGKALYEKGQVEIVTHTDNRLECLVYDNIHEHHVAIQMYHNQLLSDCDCNRFKGRHLCKHVAAAAIAGQKILNEEIKKSWENRLLFVHTTPRRMKEISKTAPDYLLVFALYNDYRGWKIRPLTALVGKIPVEKVEGLLEGEPERLIQALAQNPQVRKGFTTQINHPLKAGACRNAPAHIVSLAKILYDLGNSSSYSYYHAESSLSTSLAGALEILREENFPLYLGDLNYGNNISLVKPYPLIISSDNASVLLDIENNLDGGLRLQFHLYLGEKLWKVTKKPTVISQSPLWFLLGNQLIPAQEGLDADQIEYLSKASRLNIPADEKDTFLEIYLPGLASQFTITGKGIKTNEVTERPQPRLYLQDNQGLLEIWLKFGYGDFEVPYESRIPATSSEYDPDTATFTRVFRDPAAEKAAFRLASTFGLKRVTGSPGLFNLRARVDVVDFLMRYIPKAIAGGFEIYGEENIKNVRVNRNRPVISFRISSGIDWFDLQGLVRYGDVEVSLKEIRRALKRRENFIKLADGSIGEIPEEWLERYKHLFGLGEETEHGLRFSDQQVTLLDQLLGESENLTVDDEFKRRSQRLLEFKGITSWPIPKNMTGELLPYQKAGLDWLHFLHEYRFGGCLADDMGLGKTVQVLAFLQSLRENEGSCTASLVVVPRSLLVNWQREANKFTPGLRALEYHGQLREKDVANFDQYDLVLTTYGIVIKDIDLLRSYRFHYVILDESQAIKNPVSQSAKACRLLQAEHRLVMTGTPVENSTFELWSQFAFLNPGLLGNLEYFKSQIGGPIERDGDVETAQLLRKMVYPFILRRTKEQVAPELPPRTEHIIYGEMEPAQRKLYIRTREAYRKSLLGLIEDQGVDNARMKILEGLLRLRQICIHPLLVDRTYRGASAKFELLLETIENLLAERHKALIFSQFVETLKILRAELDRRKIRYTYLDGRTNDRQGQVDIFQNDPAYPLFLISLKAGGFGLNLTAADYVIHLDPWWNPAVEVQASDRAHRIGQDKPVFVYKYILRDSVEEKILQLQDRKRNLVEQLITTESHFFKTITPEDVKILFSE
jgi:non-specific serine/threonine protein kinase